MVFICVHHFYHGSYFFPCFSTFFPWVLLRQTHFSMGKAARQRRLQWFIGLDVASRVGLPGRGRWWNWGNGGKKGGFAMVLPWFNHGLYRKWRRICGLYHGCIKYTMKYIGIMMRIHRGSKNTSRTWRFIRGAPVEHPNFRWSLRRNPRQPVVAGANNWPSTHGVMGNLNLPEATSRCGETSVVQIQCGSDVRTHDLQLAVIFFRCQLLPDGDSQIKNSDILFI